MDAAVLCAYGEPLEITAREPPTPGRCDAVVEVEACGLCRSDWHAWRGHGEWADDGVPAGTVLGHEPAGRVRSVGAAVETVEPGDRVVVPFDLGCGRCEHCGAGRGNVCRDGRALGFEPGAPGAFAERVRVPRAEHNPTTLPEGVPFVAAAALGCRFATAYAGLERAALEADERLVVFGCGGVGLSVVQIASARGATVVAVDVDPAALSMAAELGADETIDATATDVVGTVRENGGAAVSVDALGRAETARNAVRCLRERGRHVQIGLTTDAERGSVPLPTDWMTRWEVTWLGTRGLAPSRYDEPVGAVADGVFDPGALVTREVSLGEISERLAAMDEYATRGVEVVRP
jgi:alcohol dehydrogenase